MRSEKEILAKKKDIKNNVEVPVPTDRDQMNLMLTRLLDWVIGK